MLLGLHSLPASKNAPNDLLPSLAHLPNHVLRGRNHHYDWQGVGSLSLKTFCNGRALYDVGDGRFAVDDTAYLLLNHAQPYTITIDSETVVESCCLFFGPGFAEDVRHSLQSSTTALLDEPEVSCTAPLHFFDRTYPHDALVSPALFQIRQTLQQGVPEPGWLEESFHEVMARLLRRQAQVRAEVEAFPAARPATREELYRRLHRARDYAEASLAQPVTLAEMAHAACLSPNHFLRTFRQAFHQTPHQYLTTRRLEWAKRLLVQTECSVTDICFQVGFASLGSFSSLFRRHVGISPDAYRRRKG